VGARRAAFWTLFAVTMAIYLVMILWSLPKISAAAGGAAPFDIRPFGYGFDETKAFLGALSPEGTAFYLNVQHRLDVAYPALLAATLFFAIRALAPGASPLPTLLALVALPGAVFDYLENASVTAMLNAGASGLTPELAARASLWTLLKSVFTTIAMLMLLAFVGMALWRRVSSGRKAAAT
jgi:hypothetical protein